MVNLEQTTTSWYQDLGNDSQHVIRQQFNSSSTVIGQQLTEVQIYASSSGTPTGSVTVKHKGSTDVTIGSFSASAATGTWLTFSVSSDDTWVADDWLQIDCSSIGGGSGNYINIHGDNSNPMSNSVAAKQNSSGAWEEISGTDLAFKFTWSSSGGGSEGGGESSGGSSAGGDGLPQTERLQILSTVVPR